MAKTETADVRDRKIPTEVSQELIFSRGCEKYLTGAIYHDHILSHDYLILYHIHYLTHNFFSEKVLVIFSNK